MENKKKIWVRVLSAIQILIVCALLAVVYYVYHDVTTTQQITQFSEEIPVASEEELENFSHDVYDGDYSQLENPFENISMTLEEMKEQLQSTKKVGHIEIPKINVSEQLFLSASKAALLAGVGVMKGTDYPSHVKGSSSVIAGHRGLVFTHKMFVDLDQLSPGDEIIVRKKEETLVYKVNNIKTVDADEVDQIPQDKTKSLLTLVTCTPKMIYSHRLLVFAELDRVVLN
jgi:sortase family protein